MFVCSVNKSFVWKKICVFIDTLLAVSLCFQIGKALLSTRVCGVYESLEIFREICQKFWSSHFDALLYSYAILLTECSNFFAEQLAAIRVDMLPCTLTYDH